MCAHEKGKESDGKNQQTRLGVEGDGKKVLVPGIGPIFLSLFLCQFISHAKLVFRKTAHAASQQHFHPKAASRSTK